MRASFDGVPQRPPLRDAQAVYSPREIQAILRRERSRSDRSRSEFSVVVFAIEGGGDDTHSYLPRVVLSRARMTDEIGWLEEGELCAVLPDTSAAGARCFAESVGQLALQASVRIGSQVYTYPSAWLDRSRDGGWSGRMPNAHARRLAASSGEGQSRSVFDGVRHEVQALEPLLIRRLPWWKRAMDIVGAIVGLILFSPVMLAVAIAIKLTSPGPVIFKQRRLGLGGKPFVIYKFRTMVLGAEKQQAQLRPFSEQDGPAFKIRNDPRMTPLGRFLRKTTLDEWPQFWNVLKGDASLVGPRPLPVDEANTCDCWQRQRLEVTPGLTCIWQSRGRSMVSFCEWMRMDMRYIRKRSLLTDLKIILATIPAVLFQRGAH